MSPTVGSVMTRRVATVGLDASVEQVLDVLEKHAISGVPVVGKDGKVLGIVSESDLILKVEHPNCERARYWRGIIDSSSYGAARQFVGELDKVIGQTARHVMSTPPVTIHEDEPLHEAARVMRTRHVKRLPVVDGEGRLIGIVSRGDVARSLVHADPRGQVEPRSVSLHP